MEYEVLNHNNAACTVTDADIEEAIKSGEPLSRQIVLGMGKTHDDKYLEYLYPILYHEVNYMRFDAAQGIFNLNGRKGLGVLKEKARSIDVSDSAMEWEKAMLVAMIIRIEEGTSGVMRYFMSEEGSDIVKYCLLTFYSSGYSFEEEDIRLISVILTEFLDKKSKRIKKVTREDWIEFVYFALDSLLVAAKETDVLTRMSDEASEELVDAFRRILACKATNDIKELMADITRSMKRDYALKVLISLRGQTRGGDARRAYKKALNHFGITEEEL